MPVHFRESGMSAEGSNNVMDLATRRLDRALALLEQRLANRMAEAGAEAGGLFDNDRSQLAAELDACRAREKALEETALQASQAVGRAIAEIQAALGEV
jgi:hypothetical protein